MAHTVSRGIRSLSQGVLGLLGAVKMSSHYRTSAESAASLCRNEPIERIRAMELSNSGVQIFDTLKLHLPSKERLGNSL